jgi:hypothetical protein
VYLHILETCVCHNLTSQEKISYFYPYFLFFFSLPLSFSFFIVSSFLSYSLHTLFPSFLFSFLQSPVMTYFFPFSSVSLCFPCHFSACISLISAISLFLCLYELAVCNSGHPTLFSSG